MLKAFLLSIALCFSAQAANEYTALIALTSGSVTNLNGTNAASITTGASTRIWTNSVTSPSTQMQATTNLSTAVSRLLNHLRQDAHPFTGLTAYGTNSGILLVGTSAFTVTISNSWATVSYSTNAIGAGFAVRGPRATQSALEAAVSDDRIVAGVNSAATNTVSASAPAMAAFVPYTAIDTSAELRAILGDESGTGALLFAGGDIGAGTATTASADDNTTKIATTAFVQQEIKNDTGQYFEFAISDETTALTTGTAKLTWRAPFAFTITGVRASLSIVSSSGIPTFDINESGSTILSTKLTIDASEKTSTTAATPAVVSDSSIADDAEITFDVDVAGTDTAGVKIKIFYVR